jgi:N-acetylglucosamine kinase-like BadF-type ATPase
LEAAEVGDAIARAIVDEAASELALAVLTVARKLGLGVEEFPVATSGGVLTPGGLVFEATRSRIAASAPGARVGPPRYPPEVGAARLALARHREAKHG